MKHLIRGRPLLLIIICVHTSSFAAAQKSDKIMIIIIDVARYIENFGGPSLVLPASGGTEAGIRK